MKDPMSERIMLIDLDNCVRCYACEVACRQEHDLTAATGCRWCQVVTVEPRRVDGQLHMDFVPVICFHCEHPMCAEVCPSGAIAKSDDGRVVVDGEACSGCRLCVSACPYGRMFFDEVTDTAGHCDLCAQRVEAGLEPACVQHCIGGALQLVSGHDLPDITAGQHTLLMGKICYTSSKWQLRGEGMS
jgi:tetrathionate reductase subunit B